MNEDGYKMVHFDEYCPTCSHYDLEETEEPCCYCLDKPINLYSHIPTCWDKKE